MDFKGEPLQICGVDRLAYEDAISDLSGRRFLLTNSQLDLSCTYNLQNNGMWLFRHKMASGVLLDFNFRTQNTSQAMDPRPTKRFRKPSRCLPVAACSQAANERQHVLLPAVWAQLTKANADGHQIVIVKANRSVKTKSGPGLKENQL